MKRVMTALLLVLVAGWLTACGGQSEGPVIVVVSDTPVATRAQATLPTPPPTVKTATATPEQTPSPESPEATRTLAPSVKSTESATLEPTTGVALEDILLTLEPIADGLDTPVAMAHAGDGSQRIFVVEKPGVVRVIQQGDMQAEPFLDIRHRVGSGGNEQGLLGIAFHPSFAENGHFFVNYTDHTGSTVVARLTVGIDALSGRSR